MLEKFVKIVINLKTKKRKNEVERLPSACRMFYTLASPHLLRLIKY